MPYKMLVEFKPVESSTIVELKDKPPKSLSSVNYNALFGVNLTHGICYNTAYKDTIQLLRAKLAGQNSSNAAEVKAYLNNPQSYFSVRYINTTCGYGLVANKDIPINTVVGIYSGELIIYPADYKEAASSEERAYDMSVYKTDLNGKRYSLTLRAKNYSDIMRFAIHAPSTAECNELPLADIPKKAVLTSKMIYPFAICDGIPLRYFKTIVSVKKGELVPISYGSGYWSNRGQPNLFVECKEGIKIAKFLPTKDCYKLTDELLPSSTIAPKRDASLALPPPPPIPRVIRSTAAAAAAPRENTELAHPIPRPSVTTRSHYGNNLGSPDFWSSGTRKRIRTTTANTANSPAPQRQRIFR